MRKFYWVVFLTAVFCFNVNAQSFSLLKILILKDWSQD